MKGEGVMVGETFTGDKKEPLVSPTARLEKRFVVWATARVPLWLGSQHLTTMTVAWSGLVVLSGWLAGRGSLHWLWLSSLMLVLQWLTDSLDGSVGRTRGQGLKRWGYYMDHFLDYVFMACVMGHYAFVVGEPARTLFLLLAPLYAAFEVSSWLEHGATGTFRITFNGIGPTEVRLFHVLVNTGIVVWGTGWVIAALPWYMGVLTAMLAVTVWGTQRRIWDRDMTEKNREGGDQERNEERANT
jgi:phosphatidylglycerophosphate synthase